MAEIKCAKISYHLLEYSWMLFLQKNSLLKIFIEHQQYIRFCSKYGCLSFYSNKNKKTIFIGFNNEHKLAISLNSVTLDTIFFLKARTVFLLLEYTQPLTQCLALSKRLKLFIDQQNCEGLFHNLYFKVPRGQ